MLSQNKRKMKNRWIYEEEKMRLFSFLFRPRNLEPRFLVQFIIFCDIDCYWWPHLFSISILAIIVDEFTIRINQVHYDCVVNLRKKIDYSSSASIYSQSRGADICKFFYLFSERFLKIRTECFSNYFDCGVCFRLGSSFSRA